MHLRCLQLITCLLVSGNILKVLELPNCIYFYSIAAIVTRATYLVIDLVLIHCVFVTYLCTAIPQKNNYKNVGIRSTTTQPFRK